MATVLESRTATAVAVRGFVDGPGPRVFSARDSRDGLIYQVSHKPSGVIELTVWSPDGASGLALPLTPEQAVEQRALLENAAREHPDLIRLRTFHNVPDVAVGATAPPTLPTPPTLPNGTEGAGEP